MQRQGHVKMNGTVQKAFRTATLWGKGTTGNERKAQCASH